LKILNISAISLILLSLGFSQDNDSKKVIICFDDGYYSVYKYAYPVLKAYDIPMTCALITSYIGSGKSNGYNSGYSYMRKGDIQEMIDSLNIEVASHSITHPDLTKLNDEQVRYELSRSKSILDSLFNQETITFVYPYGAVNRRIIELTKKAGYRLGRSIRWGEPNLWVDRYLIPVKDVRMSTSVDEVVRHINNHKVTVLMFHRLTPNPMVFTEWDDNQFAGLIQILALDDQIEFITFKDLYQQWWQDIMRKYLKQKGWLQDSNELLFQKIDVDQTRTFNSRISQ
jgi:peptidoglycan/xylan/chitin deacetylase (PgdA/CDA1 family)